MPGFYLSMTLLLTSWRHWHKLWPKAGAWTTGSGTKVRWFRWGPVELTGWRVDRPADVPITGTWHARPDAQA